MYLLGSVQLQGGASLPDPLTRGSAPGPLWQQSPSLPIMNSRYALVTAPPRNRKTKLRHMDTERRAACLRQLSLL